MRSDDPNALGADANHRENHVTPSAGSVSVGRDMYGGVISTGPNASIHSGETARLQDAMRALRAHLEQQLQDTGAPPRRGEQTPERDLAAELELAEGEIERTGTLQTERRSRLHERLELASAAAAGSSYLAVMATQVTQLLGQ